MLKNLPGNFWGAEKSTSTLLAQKNIFLWKIYPVTFSALKKEHGNFFDAEKFCGDFFGAENLPDNFFGFQKNIGLPGKNLPPFFFESPPSPLKKRTAIHWF